MTASTRITAALAASFLIYNQLDLSFAFQPVIRSSRGCKSSSLPMADVVSTAEVSSFVAGESGKGFGKTNPTPKVSFKLDTASSAEVKDKLVKLLLHMTGKDDEFRQVENYVNFLEDKFVAPQTLGFFNMAMAGEWQYLFTTSVGNKSSAQLRLSELVQNIDVNAETPFEGKLDSKAKWALLDEETQNFDCFGTFTISSTYKINQGTRIIMNVDEHKIEPAKGSNIPKDVPKLVGMLHRTIPTEMFDPDDLAIDTTYVDPDLRIVRFTGKRHEGVRNIFIRSGSVHFDPSKKE